METKRAIGIIRVSATKDREGESFASPEDQRDRIEAVCAREGYRLIETYEEMDVSGGKSLESRPGLSRAIDAIERNAAEVVVAAYFDRLFRSLETQAEVLRRVERAGGQVLAVDVGHVTNGSAGQWLSGTMLGAVSEYYRRSVAERVRDAQKRAVERGVVPYPGATPGYVRGEDGRLTLGPAAEAVAEGFLMRANEATVQVVREHLAAHGINLTHAGTYRLLKSRVVLGEIHFGSLANLAAHAPIVNRDVWTRVQRMSSPRGRHAKSDRLLARLGVLRCGSCGARLIAGTVRSDGYPVYRCPPTNDCSRHVHISAMIAEDVVSSRVRTALQDAQGRASMAESAQEATGDVSRAQGDLDAALRVFTLTGAQNESAAVERISELRQIRDNAQSRLDQIGPNPDDEIVDVSDWDNFPLDLRRNIIRRAVVAATVAPGGRGAERITVQLRRPSR